MGRFFNPGAHAPGNARKPSATFFHPVRMRQETPGNLRPRFFITFFTAVSQIFTTKRTELCYRKSMKKH
jgi:hypothetical protein